MGEYLKTRDEIDPKYRWRLEDIYAQEGEWEEDFKEVKILSAQIEAHQGKLGDSPASLMNVLKLLEKVERKAEKLYVYAKMRRDEDNANPHYQVLFDRAQSLNIQVNSAVSYIAPEIIAIPEEKLNAFLNERGELHSYKHFFDQLLRQRQHVLSPEEEKLLAMAADLSLTARNVFSMLNDADIKFPVVHDEEGREVELTKGRYGKLMESSDREVRREAFEALYSTYNRFPNTLAAMLASSIKKDVFYARSRKYSSSLEAALDEDNILVEVYERLIEAVHNSLGHLQRYMQLRKKILGLEELHMYDVYVPLVKEFKMDIPYEEAKELIVKALRPLGQEYVAELKKGIDSGWVDVYENKGKTSGAYSWGCYDAHPFVLLNYNNRFADVLTLAHEMGHAMHTYYSNRTQPYIYSHYSIFVAEVASTVNESLVIDYLLKNCSDVQEKMYLLNYYLEQFRGTVYRQTMFAEFEKIIHAKVEGGEALSAKEFNTIYRNLNQLYYGSEVVLDEGINIEWARIPHFYSAFYVYKYATGFSAATAIKQKILNEGEPAVRRYLDFLKSGSSDYPLNLLREAGVDLASPQPVEEALAYFGDLITEMEKIQNVRSGNSGG